MTNHSLTDPHVDELLSGYIDGELTQQDRQRVRLHCESCDECRRQLADLESLREAVGRTRLSDISKDVWREDTNDPTASTSRSTGWLLFIGGLLIAVGIGIYEFIKELDSIPLSVLLIIGGVYGGLLLLFISVLRQRLIERKSDKYEDVEI
jgi:hypothetical protein